MKIEHGTYRGWNAHQRHGIPMCEDCTEAQARYMRQLRRTRHGVGQFHFPVVLRGDLAELPTFGVILAESIRGAA